jgi:hypothetical protein
MKIGGRPVHPSERQAAPARVARGVEVYLLQRMSATTMRDESKVMSLRLDVTASLSLPLRSDGEVER